ncbi:MAG: divalent-cation tolerance protein CutA [Terriglobales bacterium]
MTECKIVLTTTGSHEEAQRIAHALVEGRLATCVNIVPGIESIYRWQEKTERADEWLLIIKTASSSFPRVRDTIKQLHSYNLPECISIEISEGSAEYLKWISNSVK